MEDLSIFKGFVRLLSGTLTAENGQRTMLTKINCAKCIGIEAGIVTVEVDISPGIGIHLIGMPDTAIKESVMRVTTALKASGLRIPGHRIVINLAPGDVRKSGTGYDLAIALGIAISSGQIPAGNIGDYIIMGELGLDGSLRSIAGALPIAQAAADNGFTGVIMPRMSACEAVEIEGIELLYADKFTDVANIISDPAYRNIFDARKLDRGNFPGDMSEIFPGHGCFGEPEIPDFSDISGQESAKRAVETAVSGGHNILLIGTPGSGKSTLAKAVAGILPPMGEEERIETGKLYSVAGIPPPPGSRRPFRAPYRSITTAALIGGGINAMPGEISLAHNGVLFLDEATEIAAHQLNALKEPLENGEITISRLKQKIRYPASFMLILAANPCPCGYFGEGGDRCKCSPAAIERHLTKLSGALLDRIDIRIYMPPVQGRTLTSSLHGDGTAETSAMIAERVLKARLIQKKRFSGTGIISNGRMNKEEAERYCLLGHDEIAFCERLVDSLGLSARGYVRILRTARTIADIGGCERVSKGHLAQAASYRKAGNLDI